MDIVIKKISEIEAAASSVMDDANIRKKAFTQEMEEKTAAFDRELDARTEEKIAALRLKMEVEMNSKLEKQKADAEALWLRMEQNYEDHHKEYAAKLFRQLTKE